MRKRMLGRFAAGVASREPHPQSANARTSDERAKAAIAIRARRTGSPMPYLPVATAVGGVRASPQRRPDERSEAADKVAPNLGALVVKTSPQIRSHATQSHSLRAPRSIRDIPLRIQFRLVDSVVIVKSKPRSSTWRQEAWKPAGTPTRAG